MNKKGITKFWIEIIGGVLVVIIIIVILLFVGSSISSSVVDAHNTQQMVALAQGYTEALNEPGMGEHVVSPFDYKAPAGQNQVYSIVFMHPEFATELMNGESFGRILNEKNKIVDLQKLSKCTKEEVGADDACLCLLRFKYKVDFFTNCIPYGENLIQTPFDEDWHEEWAHIEEWSKTKLDNLDSDAISDVVVVDCKYLSGQLGCTTNLGGERIRPCIPHYKDKPMVWLDTKNYPEIFDGGVFTSDEALDVEFVKIESKSYYSDNPASITRYPNIYAFEFTTNAKTGITTGGMSTELESC